MRRGRGWQPGMVCGIGSGRRIWLIGSQYAHSVDDFEIGVSVNIE